MRIQINPDETESNLVQSGQIQSNPNPNLVKSKQELDLDLLGFRFGASLMRTRLL